MKQKPSRLVYLIIGLMASSTASWGGVWRSGCVKSPSAQRWTCAHSHSHSSISPSSSLSVPYAVYRTITAGSTHRRCRLEPSCSLFAVQAAEKYGVLKGLFLGFARAQMQHDNQSGRLERDIGADGYFIYLDPIENWDR